MDCRWRISCLSLVGTPACRRCPGMSFQHRHSHRRLLTICEAFVFIGVRLELFQAQLRYLPGYHGYELILLVPMTPESRTPTAIYFLEEEAESTIGLASHSTPSRSNRCVTVAFILVTARLPSGLMSEVVPWQRCMMRAPLFMPAFDSLITSEYRTRPGHVVYT
jgi:hypothetical protein